MTSTLAQKDQALANFLPTPIEPVSAPQGRYIDPRLVWIGIPEDAIKQITADAQAVGMLEDQITHTIKKQKAFPYWQFRNDIQKYAPINTVDVLKNLQLIELKIHEHFSNDKTGRKDKAFNATVRAVSDGFESKEYTFKPSLYSMWSQSFLVSCLNLLDSDGGILQPFNLRTTKGNNDKTYFCNLYGSDYNRDKISKSSLELGQKFKAFRAECNAQEVRWSYGQHPGLREAFFEAFDQINEALADAYRTDDDEVVETTAEAA